MIIEMEKIRTYFKSNCIYSLTLEKSHKVHIHLGYNDGERVLEYIADSSLILLTAKLSVDSLNLIISSFRNYFGSQPIYKL